MQLDVGAIRYEELCDTNPSKPTCGWKTHWTTGSPRFHLLERRGVAL